jgi:hypothetical protein
MSLLGSQPQRATPIPIRALAKEQSAIGPHLQHPCLCPAEDEADHTPIVDGMERLSAVHESGHHTVLMDGAPCVPTMLPTHTAGEGAKAQRAPAAAFLALRPRGASSGGFSGGGEDAT